MAINNRWEIPAETKANVMQRMGDMLNDPEPRNQIAAAKVIVAAESQNQKDDHSEAMQLASQVNELLSQRIDAATSEPSRDGIGDGSARPNIEDRAGG